MIKFSCDDIKSGEEIDETYKNKMDEGVDENSVKTEDTLSIVSYTDNIIDRCDNFVAQTNSHKTLTKSAAELSAQIMRVPFDECNDATSLPASKTSYSYPYEILEKIKEVYKACSCKVCECIVGKTQQNEGCKCKPCECDDCNSRRKTFANVNSFRSADVIREGLHSYKYNEQSLHTLAKQYLLNPQCNCKPCEYAECVRTFTTPCDSIPCHCVECRTRFNYASYPKLVVAAMDIQNRIRQDCTCEPCDCANCTDRGATSNVRHEMSTGVNRPETCRCDTCFSDACLPEGTDTCSCEKRRGIRKSLQKDIDYDIRRSIITQKNPRHGNSGQLDLTAMVSDLPKINSTKPVYPSVNGCCCNECACLFCNIKDSLSTLKSSNVLSDSNFFKDDTIDSLHVERELVARKLSLKTTKVTPCLKSLKRHSDINAFSNFLSGCKYRPCEYMDCGLKRTIHTRIDCNCKRCTIKRKVNSFIKNTEKLTPPIFKQEINRPLNALNNKNQKNDGCETLAKEARCSILDECHITNLPMQNLYNNLNTLNKFHHVESVIVSLNKRRLSNVNGSDKIQEHYSDHPVPNYMAGNEHRYKKRTNSGFRDPIYLNSISKQRTANLSDTFNENKNRNVKSNYLPLSRNTNHTFINGTNKMIRRMSKFTNDNEKDSHILCYDDAYSCNENEYFQPVNKSSQCNIIGGIKENGKISVTKTVSQKKLLVPKIQEKKPQYCNQAVHYSNSVEKSQYVYAIHTEHLDVSPNSKTSNILGLEEDYKRVQSTIKDARTFSIHLKKLLDTYEKANREFENVYHNLSHSSNSLRDMVPQNVLLEAKTVIDSQTSSIFENYCKNTNTSENYNNNVTGKEFSDDIPTRESNIDTLFFHTRQNFSENRLNIRESTQSSTGFIQNSSKHETDIATKDLEKANKNVTPKEDNQKYLTIENMCNSSSVETTLIEFKQDPSNTFSYSVNDKGYNLKTTPSIFKLDPIIETNTKSVQMHYSVKKRNENRYSKRYTKMYKHIAVESNRRNNYLPKYKNCSMTTVTSDDQIKDNSNELHNSKGNEEGPPLFFDDSPATRITNKLANNLNRLPMNRHEFTVKHNDDIALIVSPTQAKSQKRIKGNPAEQAITTWTNNSKKHLQGFQRDPDDESQMKYHSAVYEIEHSPLVQNSQAKQTKFEKNSNEQIVNSESLKVESVTVRKVSHRTILVKWQVPKTLHNVEGYVLLINRRSVQKVEDNLCRESVVSSIPQEDQMLLTVRTMTKCGCSGKTIASVIYRPNSKEILNFRQ